MLQQVVVFVSCAWFLIATSAPLGGVQAALPEDHSSIQWLNGIVRPVATTTLEGGQLSAAPLTPWSHIHSFLSPFGHPQLLINSYNAEIFLHKPWRPKGFSILFEIVINVLVRSFRFIWIPMLWVYDDYTYFSCYSARIEFRRQNLTSTDVRFWRLKSIPAL